MDGPYSFTSKEFLDGLRTRYALLDHPKNKDSWRLSHQLVGITNIDEMLRDTKIETATKDISAGAGTYTAYHTVPAGKHWEITGIETSGSTANSQVKCKSATTEIGLNPATTSPLYEYKARIPLDAGDSIGRTTTGDGGDNARAMAIHYIESDMF